MLVEKQNGTTMLQDPSVILLAAVYVMLLFTGVCLKVCCVPYRTLGSAIARSKAALGLGCVYL